MTTWRCKTACTRRAAAASGTTVLAEKICGAAAARGYDLGRVAALGRKVNERGRSMGMALTSCTVPAAGKPSFELGEGEIEMGVGIHGEPGRERMPLRPVKALVAYMAEAILADLPFRGGDRVIAMVSGMGGTPPLELYLVYRRTGADPARPANRRLAPPGRQLHHQPRHGRLLDHPVAGRRRVAVAVGRPGADAGPALGDLNMAVSREDVLRWLDASQKVFAENRQQLTELDSAVGDGDFGISLDRGFTAVQAELSANPPADLRSVFQNVATVLIRTMGGTSGPLLGTFFLRAGAACAGKSELAPADVVALFQAGVEGIQQRGKAALGDKTMLDALLPAVDAMRGALEAGSGLAEILERGAAAAEAGMQATKTMQARKGRGSYLGDRSVGHQDPGATGGSSAAESRCGSVAAVIVTLCYISHRRSRVAYENTLH